MRKIARNLAIVLTLSITIFCGAIFTSCNKEEEPEPTPLTIEEIEQLVQNDFFNEDGSLKLNYWKWWYENDRFNMMRPEIQTMLENVVLGVTPVTGFEVSLIQDKNGEYTSYLVEFEPIGHICGKITDYSAIKFEFYPSPFKLLNVPKEERYFDIFSFSGIYNVQVCATYVDGVLRSLDDQVLRLLYWGGEDTLLTYWQYEEGRWNKYYENGERCETI